MFFGLKCAVIALVAEALWRVAKRRLKQARLDRGRAGLSGALFVFQIPFPIVILAAAFIGLAWRGAGRHHGRERRRRNSDRIDHHESAEPLAHRADRRLAVAGADRPAAPGCLGGDQSVHADGLVLRQDGGGHVRRRLCGARLRRAASGAGLRLALHRQHDRRTGAGRNDAGAADPGAQLRRLSMRRISNRAAVAPCSPAARRRLRHLGDLRAELYLDLSRRALCRAAAQNRLSVGDAGDGDGGGGRRDRQPGAVVRAARAVRRTSTHVSWGWIEIAWPHWRSVHWIAVALSFAAGAGIAVGAAWPGQGADGAAALGYLAQATALAG